MGNNIRSWVNLAKTEFVEKNNFGNTVIRRKLYFFRQISVRPSFTTAIIYIYEKEVREG